MAEPRLGEKASPARIAIFYFAGFAAYGMYVPYFPTWLEARQVRGAAMGLALAAVPAIGIVAPPVVGAIADALHLRGKVLRGASLVAAIAFALIALSAHVGMGAAILLGAGMVLFAAARSPLTLVADVLALEALAETPARYGILRLFGSAGFLGAALLTGVVIDTSAPLALPSAIAVAYIVTYVASLGLPARAAPIPRLTLQAIREAVPNTVFLVAAFFSQIAQSSYDVYFTIYARGLGASDARIGWLWAAGVTAEIALMWQSPRILARVRPARLFAIGLLGGAIRWLLLSRATSFVVVMALQPLHACSFACVWVGGIALAAERTRHPATSQGVFSAVIAIGATIGMVAWGALGDARGGSAVYACAGFASLAGAAVAMFVRKR